MSNDPTATIRNAELQDLVDQLKNQNDRRDDYVAPASRIEASSGVMNITTEDGSTVALAPTPTMIGTAAHRLSLPVKTLRDFHQGGASDDPMVRFAELDAFDAMVNARLIAAEANDRSFMVRSFRTDTPGTPGVGRALLSDRYSIIDNFDVLMATLQGLRDGGHDVRIASCDLTETRMRVRVVSNAVQYVADEWLKGYKNPFSVEHTGYNAGEEPVVFAGFEISNSETGGGAFSIVPRFEVLICRNGARIKKDAMREIHLGGKLEAGQVRWSADTQRTAIELVGKKTRDAVSTFLDADYLERTIVELTEQGKTAVPAEKAKAVVEQVAKSQRWSDSEAEGVLKYFYTGGQQTAGGVMQAVTAFAQDVADPERAAEIEGDGIDAMTEAARLVTV